MNKILGDFISSSDNIIFLSTCREEVDYRNNKSLLSYSVEIGRNHINNSSSDKAIEQYPLEHNCWESITALISDVFSNCLNKICRILRESNDEKTEGTNIAVIEGWNGNYFVGELNGVKLTCLIVVDEQGEYINFMNPSMICDISHEYFSYKQLVIIDEYEYMAEFGEIEGSIERIFNICNTLYTLSK